MKWLRFWLASKLIGTTDTEKETAILYDKIWPKHEYYKKRTLRAIRRSFLRIKVKANHG